MPPHSSRPMVPMPAAVTLAGSGIVVCGVTVAERKSGSTCQRMNTSMVNTAAITDSPPILMNQVITRSKIRVERGVVKRLSDASGDAIGAGYLEGLERIGGRGAGRVEIG